jgi:hypothetical protein
LMLKVVTEYKSGKRHRSRVRTRRHLEIHRIRLYEAASPSRLPHKSATSGQDMSRTNTTWQETEQVSNTAYGAFAQYTPIK